MGTGSGIYYLDAYLAEIHFVDGTALAATDFGEEDSNGVWQPIDCKDDLTYGTNGFYLKFADNSSKDALGTDSSGNSNTWTVNNIASGTDTDYTKDIDLTNGDPVRSTNDIYDIFDGNTSTGAETDNGDGNSLLFDFANGSGSIPVSTNIQVWVGGSGGRTLKVNGNTIATSTGTGNNPHTITGQSQLNSVEVVSESGTRSGFLLQISVDGSALVSDNPVTVDSLIDTPTNYTATSGNNGGNYCTMNPLDNGQGTQPTFSNGNLETENTGSDVTWTSCRGTIGMKTGKYYFEWTNRYAGGGLYGIANAAASTNPVGTGTGGWTWGGQNRYFNGSSSGTGLASNHQVGDVIQIAFDADTGKLWFGRNNTFYDSSWGTTGNPSTGANNTTSVTTGVDYFPALANLGSSGASNADSSAFNAGQRPFAYTPPTGFVSLCTENLSESAYASIADGSTAFDIDTYTGNNTTHERSEFSFSPDFVWIKRRNGTNWHQLFDTVRGATKRLYSNEPNTEDTASGSLDSFDSDGFTLGSDGAVNNGGSTYVAWAWDSGTSAAASNTDGSITSSVKVSQANGFSIVTWTGTKANDTVGHGLNAKPGTIWIKNRSSSGDWAIYHQSPGATKRLTLNSTGGAVSQSAFMNDTEPTASVFSVSTSDNANASSDDLVAYCFAPVEGFSAFGSYTGNGSSTGDGPFVYTGMRPRYVWLKRTDSGGSWLVFDTARSLYNLTADYLKFDANSQEANDGGGSGGWHIDILSNGFKVRSNGFAGQVNENNGTWAWGAFAEHPFKTARAR